MRIPAFLREKANGWRDDQADADTGRGLTAVLGFSLIGLLLTVMLSTMPIAGGFVSTQLLLIAMAAPVAAWLGFTLGSPD